MIFNVPLIRQTRLIISKKIRQTRLIISKKIRHVFLKLFTAETVSNLQYYPCILFLKFFNCVLKKECHKIATLNVNCIN
jgi:hypothetical protein